ncbi:hypothetical protein G6653_06560 [Polynucleobacter paneuropaeus]|jgi:hypothetical protein|nr:hypothetical protein [Polynucleobacter paneuropaeus]MBT8611626.1 hypothetical protein [Polynucleobacter paneuropaeus]
MKTLEDLLADIDLEPLNRLEFEYEEIKADWLYQFSEGLSKIGVDIDTTYLDDFLESPSLKAFNQSLDEFMETLSTPSMEFTTNKKAR